MSAMAPATGCDTIEVISPVDGTRIGSISISDAAAVDAAVSRGRAAYQAWSRVPIKERAQPLYRFKELVERDVDALSQLVSAENGKTLAEAEAGIRKGLEVVEFAAALPIVSQGGTLEVSRHVDCFSRRYPLGVVAGITPFNFPAMVPMWMYPLAIAAGNAFLLKPSEQCPLTSQRIAELLLEAGLPEDVFQVVQGDRTTVDALLQHPGITAVAFVGSTEVAESVYRRAVASGKRCLALGGAKNHLVVVPDADPPSTADNVVSSATGCAGQRCMAASVLIAVGDCQDVLWAIEERMRQLEVGKTMGAVISLRAKERIEESILRAENEGARIVVDGRGAVVSGKPNGFYVGPTLIDHVQPGSHCATEEIFGPVLSVIRVDTLEQAIAIENSSPYGNAASIYTSNGATARIFEEQASAGMIGINIGVPVPREPFSFGGWNASRFGIGDITGPDAVSFWTQTKKITQKWTVSGSQNWMS